MGPKLIEDAQLLIREGWNVIRTWMHAPDERDAAGRRVFEARESVAETATLRPLIANSPPRPRAPDADATMSPLSLFARARSSTSTL